MHIENAIKEALEGSHYERIDSVLLRKNKVSATWSFWGARIVTVKGYEGSITIDRLAALIQEYALTRIEKHDLSFCDRSTGLKIEEKIRTFYQITDKNLSDQSILTRLFAFLRNWSFSQYTPRYFAENRYDYLGCSFATLDLKEFEKAFGPLDFTDEWESDHPHYKGRSHAGVLGIHTSDEGIREKAREEHNKGLGISAG